MVSIVATAYFLTAAVGAHVVMTQYNFFADYISDYAVGPWGWIYGSAFLASAIGSIALAASLVLLLPSQALSRIGVVLLVLVGVTYAVDFAFPTDILPPGAPPTTAVGIVHLLYALLGWVLFTVGSVLISSSLRHVAYWKAWQPLLTTLAWLSVLLLVVLVGVVISKAPFGGLAEKLFILDRNVWALALGILAFRAPDSVLPLAADSASSAIRPLSRTTLLGGAGLNERSRRKARRFVGSFRPWRCIARCSWIDVRSLLAEKPWNLAGDVQPARVSTSSPTRMKASRRRSRRFSRRADSAVAHFSIRIHRRSTENQL